MADWPHYYELPLVLLWFMASSSFLFFKKYILFIILFSLVFGRRARNPKTHKNESKFDRNIFYKESVCAINSLYVKLFQQKIRVMWILRSILDLFIAGRLV